MFFNTFFVHAFFRNMKECELSVTKRSSKFYNKAKQPLKSDRQPKTTLS